MSINKTSGRPTRRKNALGRGLGALLEDSSQEPQVRDNPTREFSSINEIPLDSIEVNPFQPRTHFDKEALQELADSIMMQGIIQPITVRLIGTDRYQIISGERRVQASKLAGLTLIPAYVRKANDQQMLEMALIENIQRENLNAIEIALSYQRLISECDLRQEQLGDRVGKNRSTVNNYLRLLKLPPDIQAALRDARLTMGHARALINVDTIEQQLHLFHQIVQEDLSVRQVEALVRELAAPKKPKPTATSAGMSSELQAVQNQLSSHFGTRVHIKTTGKEKGEIKIPYLSTEDLNRILDLLQT
ncbi:ParB/RepB/Spo0J family partition protein [Tunicatimonas pelagia]|uniref:ParB/RepB/Spo0J family partition protein n=1 Tax=Tunicatimonas pelagia TaxID=931531 RepID=UPI00266622F1|nr:ParB/RepB/Spo0J family partition protein [Tunicatimonas pelagia]WKN40592.1 ParB/RepB/Spo0J family partition protein [Tunicatimonas pelagia]